MRKRILILLPFLLLLFAFFPLQAMAELVGCPITEPAVCLDKGGKLSILGDYDGDVEWTTSDRSIATVSRGVITGRKAGVCTITATLEDGSVYLCEVTVTQPVTEVTIPSRKTISAGETYQLVPEIDPSNATDKTLSFSSSDPSVASVDESGLITAHRAGSATITAKALSGKKDTIKITVSQPITELSLNYSSASVDKGQKLTLSTQYLPADATEKTITWTSSDKSIASVSKGTVTARKAGRCVITATAESGIYVSCEVTVTQPVTEVTLPSKMTLPCGEAYLLVPEIKPSNATDKTLSFSSSDPAVASVDESGLITAHRAGSATITAKALSGKKDTIKITVSQPITELSLNYSSASVDKGQKLTLSTQYLPADATEKTITWTSSDKSIASVSKGTVTARKAGACVITATAESGVSVSCEITVTQPVTEVVLPYRQTVSRNNTYQLIPEIKPANATDKTIFYHSSNPAVASVDEHGLVFARADGQAVITATARSGKKDTVKITVETKRVESLSMSRYYLSLYPGGTDTVAALLSPVDASFPGLRFSSSHLEIASVSPEGTVSALAPGEAEITVTSVDNPAAFAVCQVFVRHPDSTGRLDGLVIGINPGHQVKGNFAQAPLAPGSKETGNKIGVGCTGVKTGNYEYAVNLQVSLMLRDLLEAEGAVVVMTRTANDVNLTNIERAQMLNAAGVDLALQIHCNSSATDSAARNGIELYARHADLPALNAAAYMLEEMIRQTGAVNRGVKKSDHYMSLNWSEVPAVLVEMGYMSNPKEDVLLGTPAYQAKLAEGMYEGIARYFGR